MSNITVLQLPMTVGTALDKLLDRNETKAIIVDELGEQQGLVLQKDIIQLVRDRTPEPVAIQLPPHSVAAQGESSRRQLQSPGNGNEPGNLSTDGRYEASDPTVSQQQRNLADALGGDVLLTQLDAQAQARAMADTLEVLQGPREQTLAQPQVNPAYHPEMPESPQGRGDGVAPHHTLSQERSPSRQRQESSAADIVLVLDHRGHVLVLGTKTYELRNFLKQQRFQFRKVGTLGLWKKTWAHRRLRGRASFMQEFNDLETNLRAIAEELGLTFVAVAARLDSRASPATRGPPAREGLRQ